MGSRVGRRTGRRDCSRWSTDGVNIASACKQLFAQISKQVNGLRLYSMVSGNEIFFPPRLVCVNVSFRYSIPSVFRPDTLILPRVVVPKVLSVVAQDHRKRLFNPFC